VLINYRLTLEPSYPQKTGPNYGKILAFSFGATTCCKTKNGITFAVLGKQLAAACARRNIKRPGMHEPPHIVLFRSLRARGILDNLPLFADNPGVEK